MRVSHSDYREMMADAGAPEILVLAERHRRVRKPRRLRCGHEAQAGDYYRETVYLLDGDFHVDHECSICLSPR